MSHDPRVRRARLEMWLGFTGFFLVMSIVNLTGVLVTGTGNPLVALLPFAALLALFAWLAWRWRGSRDGRR